MTDIKTYIAENQSRFLDELFGLIRIPSVSPRPENKPFMKIAAGYISELLLKAGVDHSQVYETPGNPVVYGEKITDKTKPTVLVYGHYDVMPADPLDLWTSPPFEPEIRDNRIYARGANDDKGQMFMHIKAFEYLAKSKKLNCNVKFMIEGEEEVGSAGLKDFCTKNRELLASDIIIVSDTTMATEDTPSITNGLRGICSFEVEVTGPDRDLHSGHYGGAVMNPVNALSKIIAGLTDHQQKITIPGFYDDVEIISDIEREELKKAPFHIEKFKKSIKIPDVYGETGFTVLERIGMRPALDVNGIWGGYSGEGTKTIIPSKAFAKITIRLVPDQDPDKIAALFEKHIKNTAPAGIKVDVKYLHGGKAYVSPIESKGFVSASLAYEKTFGKKPIPIRSGGSIPIISDFESILGVKSVLMGFGLESDAIHSPNENFRIEYLHKGIETITWFYHYFAGVNS
ncbi:MAG: dipeptidase [Bacteroidales bacterium]|nr:dipeptidase [Bacteroidales bacterium]